MTAARAVPSAPAAPAGKAPGPQLLRAGGLSPAGQGLQPGGEVVLAQLAGRVLRAEPGQERQADPAVQLREQGGPGGERGGQVGAQLVAGRDPVAGQVAAGADGRAQREGRGRVRDQRPQPDPVGAQHAGQHEGVEPVVLGAGRPVTRPQVLHLPRRDHHHGQPRREQGIDEDPLPALDRDLGGSRRAQPADQLADAGLVVGGAEPDLDLPGLADDARDMVRAGPVDAGGHPAGRSWGKNLNLGILHDSLLAAKPSGEAPL